MVADLAQLRQELGGGEPPVVKLLQRFHEQVGQHRNANQRIPFHRAQDLSSHAGS
jgi:hypothetical protein